MMADFASPWVGFGLAGPIIGWLVWQLSKKEDRIDTLVDARIADKDMRVADMKERAQDLIKSAAVIEQMTANAIRTQDANEARWKVLEAMNVAGVSTAKAVDGLAQEVTAVRRVVDANTVRLENKIAQVRP